MSQPSSLWRTEDRLRYFLLPDDFESRPGTLRVRSLTEETLSLAPESIEHFEMTEEQARCIANEQLGQTLDQFKQGIDERLADLHRRLDEQKRTPVTGNTTVTPNAAQALFHLLKTLPGVIGNSLSGQEKRIEAAKTAMASLQRQLADAGIDLDDRFTSFPGRIANLQEDVAQARAAKRSKTNEPPSGKE